MSRKVKVKVNYDLTKYVGERLTDPKYWEERLLHARYQAAKRHRYPHTQERLDEYKAEAVKNLEILAGQTAQNFEQKRNEANRSWARSRAKPRRPGWYDYSHVNKGQSDYVPKTELSEEVKEKLAAERFRKRFDPGGDVKATERKRKTRFQRTREEEELGYELLYNPDHPQKCTYCPETRGPFHKDHVPPLATQKLRRYERALIVLSCQSCNSRLSDYPEECLNLRRHRVIYRHNQRGEAKQAERIEQELLADRHVCECKLCKGLDKRQADQKAARSTGRYMLVTPRKQNRRKRKASHD